MFLIESEDDNNDHHYSDRTEKDGQIINVILHAYRNLAFIKDLPANAFKSSDQAEFSSFQVCYAQHSHTTSDL